MKLDKKFYPIAEAARISGLSKKALRAGCHEGRIPHIRAGRNFKVDLERLFETLEAESNSREA